MTLSDDFCKAVMKYSKIEYEGNETVDTNVKETLEAVVRRIEVETGKAFTESEPLMRHTAKMIFDDWYNHHGDVTNENIRELPLTFGAKSNLNVIALSSLFKDLEVS